ncbi:MAG: class I SAM-dependent RNA methyltransferase [Chloroflexi bacterium]|nr:class I SAM-dependent RNA methyltransferase [Chloroflexota bacterium]
MLRAPGLVRPSRSRDGGPYHRGMTLDTAADPHAEVVPERPPRKRQKRRRRRRGRLVDRPRIPVELELTGFAAGGVAMGRAPDGRIAFVEFGIPGERVIAEITSEESSYIEARTAMVLEESPERVEPRCEYYGRCGGCQLQHIAYGEQLRLKTGVVREQMRRIGRFEDAEVDTVLREMIGMNDPWAYRNHMRFTVRRDGDIGFMEHGTHRFLRVDHCEIANPEANRVLRNAQGRTMQTKQLTVRVGEHSGESLVQPKLRWRPGRRGNVRSGQQHYHELLRGARYRVSSPAFFQVNSRQAERLIELVVARARAVGPRLVADAYSGVGTFAVALAQVVPDVVTIEASSAAGDDAEVNLAPYDNVRRITGTVEEQLPALNPQPDVVVVDPPRAGLDASIIETVVASDVQRVVYVSCDPATLARDLRRFVDGGFTIAEMQPIDMFPHTQHIECITTLDRAE